jgi:hypothetical protein
VITGDNDLLLGLLALVGVLEFSSEYNPTPDKLRESDAHAMRALALNPNSAPALYAKAIVAEAETYAAGGRRTEALDWLRNAISLGVVNGTYVAARSPFFASLRGDPEFQALVGEARARAARERT